MRSGKDVRVGWDIYIRNGMMWEWAFIHYGLVHDVQYRCCTVYSIGYNNIIIIGI